jgi:hypothetical protein
LAVQRLADGWLHGGVSGVRAGEGHGVLRAGGALRCFVDRCESPRPDGPSGLPSVLLTHRDRYNTQNPTRSDMRTEGAERAQGEEPVNPADRQVDLRFRDSAPKIRRH